MHDHTRKVCEHDDRNLCPNSYIKWKTTFIVVFWQIEWLVWDDTFYLKFWVKLILLERKRRFSIDTRSWRLSRNTYQKVKWTLIGTHFPTSLRWTSYVVPKPPEEVQQSKTAVFRVKLHFTWRRSATKFLGVNTVSNKVVRRSLAYLSVQKWFAGDVLYYVKIWPKLANPFQKSRFPINIRS